MKSKGHSGVSTVEILALVAMIVVAWVTVLVVNSPPSKSSSSKQAIPAIYERTDFSPDRMVEYLGDDMHGKVEECFAFPTNKPVIFIVRATVLDPKDKSQHWCIGHSPKYLTNGTAVIARSVRFTDAGGGRRVTFVFPLE